MSAPVWVPSEAYERRSRLRRFLDAHELTDVAALVRRADDDPEWYWGAVADALALGWLSPPRRVAGPVGGDMRAWFPGARYNLALDAVDRWTHGERHDERALSWEAEDGARGAFTFAELEAEVRRVAAGLRRLGVRLGDRVALQLPMVPAAAVGMLACARIGAIAVPLFSGFGPRGTLERLQAAEARVHVVAASYARRGRTVDALEQALALRAPVEHTVVVGDAPAAPRDIVDWNALDGDDDDAAELDAEHPLLLAYTSGTTGRPKGVVLSHAGFAIKAGSDAAWCFDLQPGEVAAWITDPGWVMFPITVLGGLVAGAAAALLDGAVDWPDAGRLWRFAGDHRVTMLGVSPTLVRTLMEAGALPTQRPAALRVLASSGEPWTREAFAWLFERVGGGRIPIVNYSGGTEVSGAILSNTTIQPVHGGAFAGPVPGMGADVLAPDGAPLRGDTGELALRLHSPGMTRGFWGEPERYRETYWSRWPGVWHHGDWACVHENGTWTILGRSDDTLKIAGKRIGPAEVEAVVNAHPGVAESAAIGVPDPVKGEGLVVVVRPAAAGERDGLREQVAAHVAATLGRPFRPARVVLVPALPRTRSGKLVRRVVRAAYLGEDVGDVSSLERPEVVAMIGAAA